MSLNINFYCDEKYYGCAPEPTPSSKQFPKWFSDLPLNNKRKLIVKDDNIYNLELTTENKNLKNCFGISEFLSTGYIISSWADFIFREQENGDLYVNWVENSVDMTDYFPNSEHLYHTMPNKPIYGHYGKVPTPWSVKTDKGISCLITHPVWHRNKNFTSATGIFHTDVCPMPINWFFEWNFKIKNKMDVENIDLDNQIVSKGEPIILIIPFYRKEFSHKIHYVSKKISENITNSYLNSAHRSVNGKCPYTEFRKTIGKLF